MSPIAEHVQLDAVSDLRSDASNLASVLSDDGGIELIQGRPFPIGGPGCSDKVVVDLVER
jgi:hypothetical protein